MTIILLPSYTIGIYVISTALSWEVLYNRYQVTWIFRET